MLVWEDPMTAALTLTKTTPRSWLQAGERVAVRNAPTSHGRVSFNISSALAGEKPAVTVHGMTACESCTVYDHVYNHGMES